VGDLGEGVIEVEGEEEKYLEEEEGDKLEGLELVEIKGMKAEGGEDIGGKEEEEEEVEKKEEGEEEVREKEVGEKGEVGEKEEVGEGEG